MTTTDHIFYQNTRINGAPRALVVPADCVYLLGRYDAYVGSAKYDGPSDPSTTEGPSLWRVMQVLGNIGFTFTRPPTAEEEEAFTVVRQSLWGHSRS